MNADEHIVSFVVGPRCRIDFTMRITAVLFPVLLFVGLALAAPTTTDNEKITIDQDFFPEELVAYTAEHEILSLTVPLNSVNFDENEDNEVDDDSDDDDSLTVFFVQGEPKADGGYDYRGLYKLYGRKATLILENGRASAASNDDSKLVFLGATDGLYLYDAKEDKTEKYGTLTDSVLDLAKENGTDALYMLTDDHSVYKVTEGGTKKTKIEGIHAHEIVLDFSNNLYFLADDKLPYVYNGQDIKKIEGLPTSPTYAKLIKPPFIIEDGVPYISDEKSYVAYVNGTSEITEFEMKVKPSAYAMEATLIQYFAYQKKIYEYNILALILSDMLSDLNSFLEEKKDTIQSIATRSRSDLRL